MTRVTAALGIRHAVLHATFDGVRDHVEVCAALPDAGPQSALRTAVLDLGSST